MPSTEPEIFHHYRVLRREDGSLWELGRGAMGVTWKAEDTNLRTTVALKVINTLLLDNSTSRDRFIREARAAASLQHRNVAAVYHLGQNGGAYFYAMEFIDGVTVTKLIREEGPQPWPRVLRYALQVARALMAANDKQLVHRDLKPDNLMLVAEAGEDDLVVKVIDFGLAKSLAEIGGSMVAVSGSGFIGTPLFASPEQCEEIAPDIRSDLYSLGVVIWYALTGAPVFGGPLGKVFAQHISAPPPWSKLPADLPENVRALLARMLAKDRAERPQTPAELRREIEHCLRASGSVTPASIASTPLADGPATGEAPADASAIEEPSSGSSGTTLLVPAAETLLTMAGFPRREPAPPPARKSGAEAAERLPAPVKPPADAARPFAVSGVPTRSADASLPPVPSRPSAAAGRGEAAAGQNTVADEGVAGAPPRQAEPISMSSVAALQAPVAVAAVPHQRPPLPAMAVASRPADRSVPRAFLVCLGWSLLATFSGLAMVILFLLSFLPFAEKRVLDGTLYFFVTACVAVGFYLSMGRASKSAEEFRRMRNQKRNS